MMELRKDIRDRFLELARQHAGSDFFEEALRELAGELLRSGVPRDAVYQELEALRPLLAQEWGMEDAEDQVLDVMDYVAGWCSPHMKI